MAMRRIPPAELSRLWQEHGVALCAEAQADGVPCSTLGKSCTACEQALATWLARHPESDLRVSPSPNGRRDGLPECGP